MAMERGDERRHIEVTKNEKRIIGDAILLTLAEEDRYIQSFAPSEIRRAGKLYLQLMLMTTMYYLLPILTQADAVTRTIAVVITPLIINVLRKLTGTSEATGNQLQQNIQQLGQGDVNEPIKSIGNLAKIPADLIQKFLVFSSLFPSLRAWFGSDQVQNLTRPERYAQVQGTFYRFSPSPWSVVFGSLLTVMPSVVDFLPPNYAYMADSIVFVFWIFAALVAVPYAIPNQPDDLLSIESNHIRVAVASFVASILGGCLFFQTVKDVGISITDNMITALIGTMVNFVQGSGSE